MNPKVVLITGASSGIGKALALEYASKGFNLVIAARNVTALNDTALVLSKMGVEVLAVQADVSLENDCKKLIEAAVDKFQGIDILINNAGISMRALFNDMKLQVFKDLMGVNFWGAVYCSKYALPYLLKSKGSIVGVSSIAGLVGLPARTAYSASKYALQGFLEALRNENKHLGLHVLIACPGFTASNIRKTALTADGSAQGESPRKEDKMMSAEEVAKRIASATEQRKNKLVLTNEGKLAYFLSKFFPSIINSAVINKMKKEPDSPLKS